MPPRNSHNVLFYENRRISTRKNSRFKKEFEKLGGEIKGNVAIVRV
jgi:hypothetical protein